jgi:hypothetical protein
MKIRKGQQAGHMRQKQENIPSSSEEYRHNIGQCIRLEIAIY